MLCESAEKMNRLVEGLLAISQQHLQPVRKQKIRLSDFVPPLIDESRREHPGRKLVFRLNNLPDCEADAVLLKQVLVNLIANAIKFTAPRAVGVIEIGFREMARQTVYSIRDNGVGFDMRYAHRLFDVFQRLHRADEFEGTGIGLSIVRRIIQRHGGSIWAESEPGKGATFYFSLTDTNEGRAGKAIVPMAGAEGTWGRTVGDESASLAVGRC
jgi:light-regulated signal transduction histidine kinase (bacteriophytochrome)